MNKELLPGDRLSTEMELAEQFGVSRITSKRALEELRSGGMIYRVRGRGSFVAEPQKLEKAADKESRSLDYGKIIAIVIPFSCANGDIIYTIRGHPGLRRKREIFLISNTATGVQHSFVCGKAKTMGEANNVLNAYMNRPDRLQSVLEYYMGEKLPEGMIFCIDTGKGICLSRF